MADSLSRGKEVLAEGLLNTLPFLSTALFCEPEFFRF